MNVVNEVLDFKDVVDLDSSIDFNEIELEQVFFGDKLSREFQVIARNQVEQAFLEGCQRVCLTSPTGSGKTIMAGLIMMSSVIRKLCGVSNNLDSNGNYIEKIRVLFVAHRNRLLQQAIRTYAAGIGIELITQSCFSEIPQGVLDRGWHITILDEAHHESMITIQYQLMNLTQSSQHTLGFIPLLGLTATPDRADGCLIKFDKFITAITRDEAVKKGYLAETELYTFVDSTQYANKVGIISDIISSYQEEIGRGIMFVSTREEAKALEEYINKNTSFMSINVSETTDSILNDVLDQFSNGLWDIIINCDRLGEGVDVIGCDSVFIGRTVGSYPLLNQYIGRAARPDSKCKVFCLVNPLTDNLDPTVVVGTPQKHMFNYKRGGKWVSKLFNITTEIVDDVFSGYTTNVMVR